MVIDLKGMIAGALLKRYGETPLAKIAISGMQKGPAYHAGPFCIIFWIKNI